MQPQISRSAWPSCAFCCAFTLLCLRLQVTNVVARCTTRPKSHHEASLYRNAHAPLGGRAASPTSPPCDVCLSPTGRIALGACRVERATACPPFLLALRCASASALLRAVCPLISLHTVKTLRRPLGRSIRPAPGTRPPGNHLLHRYNACRASCSLICMHAALGLHALS